MTQYLNLLCHIVAVSYLLTSVAYAAGQSVEPSSALLKIVGVDAYSIAGDIRLKVSRDDIKSPLGRSVCDKSYYLPLLITSKISGVSTIKAAVETISHTQPALIFSINNHGGLSSPNMFGTLSLNLSSHESYGVMNIWVFYFTDKGVFANYVQAQCVSE